MHSTPISQEQIDFISKYIDATHMKRKNSTKKNISCEKTMKNSTRGTKKRTVYISFLSKTMQNYLTKTKMASRKTLFSFRTIYSMGLCFFFVFDYFYFIYNIFSSSFFTLCVLHYFSVCMSLLWCCVLCFFFSLHINIQDLCVFLRFANFNYILVFVSVCRQSETITNPTELSHKYI